MSIKKFRKLFIQFFFLSIFFFLFSFLSSNKIYATSCGGMGGNSCTSQISGWSCHSLGNSYYPGTSLECAPCWSCSPPAAPAPPPPPPSQGSSCGSIGGNACSSASPNYTGNCVNLGNTDDCSPCYSCSPAAAPPTPTPVPGGGGGTTTCGGWCQSQVGHSSPPWCSCTSTSSDSSYILKGCTSSGISDCNGSCCAFTSSSGSDGSGGGGDNTTKICGQICSEHGSTDGATGCACRSSGSSCPSPLVSYGASSDCAVCCGWPAVAACSAPPPPPPPPPPSPPTCVVSLSPSSLVLQAQGSSKVLTANVSVQNGSVSQVNFSTSNAAIAFPNPDFVSSPSYTVPIYGNNIGSARITAQAILSPSGSCLTSIPVSVEAQAWFQTQGGDIYTGGNLTSNIPASANDLNLSLNLDKWPGIITEQDSNGIDLGSGFPSGDTSGNWVASSRYEGKPYGSFQFFKKKFAAQMAVENYSSSAGINAPSEDNVYYAKSGRTLSGDWSLGNDRWIVLLVEGDVAVNTDIIVPKGSFLAIVSTGSIIFSSSVTKAQGLFVADSHIDTSSGNTAFEGQGVFATSQFILGRDFNDARNGITPAETFIARPDFIMSSYKDAERNVWWFSQIWKELAP